MTTSSDTGFPEPPAEPGAIDARPLLSLGFGAAGIALTHLARGSGRSHAWIMAATADGVDTGGRATLFHGLPALAFVLSHAQPEDYPHARRTLLGHLQSLAQRRTEAAHARIDQAKPASFAEYDLISGLTGIGVALLRTDPNGAALESVLRYLVRLTEPLRTPQGRLPGWWARHDPWGSDSRDFPHGHANLGMAHGAAGPLALLSLAYRSGKEVPRHVEAIRRICATLDSWRRDAPGGPWWPGWVAHGDHAPGLRRPGPPSWCYGTPGLARAQQLAGLALADRARCRIAEEALARCLDDPVQQALLQENGLCHGRAGILHVLRRMADDQRPDGGRWDLGAHVGPVRSSLLRSVHGDTGNGFLEGRAGAVLALSAPDSLEAPDWDSCLLLSC
ncbi:lanthionine synthetase C family protein [Streptomonospora salina]|uniref:Lanthionine synthetase n=1 Tax=Streptomonospora salina TaxID=104205 RepID=A0A841EFR5_9ACTN|nr:lanthionine synthetase C family protein [Streptomonospora salina]MBB6000179.1 hypothetical protein [Streptomonospora salina]